MRKSVTQGARICYNEANTAGCVRRQGGYAMKRRIAALLCALLLMLAAVPGLGETIAVYASEHPVSEDGWYDTMEEVCVYLDAYGALPGNFITKNEARELGWSGGSLEPYAEGCCIGGDRFGNREGRLPDAAGRSYTECDIDTLGAASRGAKRIVFSNDGLIYYTEDHYETFELLYGEE